MRVRILVHRLLSLLVSFSLLLTPTAPIVQAQPGVTQAVSLQPEPPAQNPWPVWLPLIGTGESAAPSSDLLYRVHIAVSSPARWQRLEQLGVVILQQDEISATVLVDFLQLEQLAKLQFQPRGTDEFSRLVNANAEKRPWLARAMRPVLEQAAAVGRTASPTGEIGAASALNTQQLAALDAVRASLNALTVEQRAAIADSFSLDDDGDGLTNTEESWWCTDPLNADSNGNGKSDGDSVRALRDPSLSRVERHVYGPPYRLWPPFVATIPPGATPTCLLDADKDSIPDLVEQYVIGTSSRDESTDGDKFDDGQEFFGITYCPGGSNFCDYGQYPRAIDSSFISERLPTWIRPPGDSPFVAAYPVIEFSVAPDTIRVVTKEIKTIEKTITQGEEISTGFAETKGNSTTVGTIDTNTRSGWQEHSSSVGGIEPASSAAVDLNVSVEEPQQTYPFDQTSDTVRDIQLEATSNGQEIVSNFQFLLSSQSLQFDIQTFLDSSSSILRTYQEPVFGESWSAARIIRYNAIEFGLNPQVLLVFLELFDHLVSNPDASIPIAVSLDGTGSTEAGFFGYVRQRAQDLMVAFEEAKSDAITKDAGSIALTKVFAENLFMSTEGQNNEIAAYKTRFTDLFVDWFGNPHIENRLTSRLEELPSGFRLPYEGDDWRYTSGPHHQLGTNHCGINVERQNCSAGAWSAIDIAVPKPLLCPGSSTPLDKWAVAAYSGIVESSDGNQVIVDHRNGWKTYYVHLDPQGRIARNTEVQAGSRLGHPACIGNTNGIHVHFAIFREGVGFVDIEGIVLSGWTVRSTGRHYQGTMARCSSTIVASSVIPNSVDGCPAPKPGACYAPKVPTPGPTPGMSSNQKSTKYGESIGRSENTWWGRFVNWLSGSNIRTGDDISLASDCGVNMSCSTQISGRSNASIDYSSQVSAGACASPPQTDGGSLGVGGGGAGIAYNDDGGGNFTALRTWSETTTTGEGWSTSHSDLRTETEYSEITRSTVNTLVSSEAWSTATTADPTDAARLTFNYSLANTGSDMAVQVTGLRANLLIGDLPAITVNLPDRTNIEPDKAKGPFESGSIPLTLEQLAAIDNGAPIRVVLADYGYNDSLYDTNAWGRSVLFHIDDGIADGDESFDTYLIVTNLVAGETYQETLARYFPTTVFEGGLSDSRTGTLTSISTPEYDGNGEITEWISHPVNDRAWWELALSAGGETEGVKHFKDMPAKARSYVYLRYMVDTDGDGYTDRTERDAATDTTDPDSHPRPLLVVAKHTKVTESTATVQIALQNLGDFDASSVELWAIAPDDSITIEDNLVGGGGRVRAGRRVVLGSRISAPDLTAWSSSTAKPAPSGQFDGAAQTTFRFRADTAGTVGSSAGLQISWSIDGATWTPLNVGSGYTPWTPLPLRDGLSIAFSPGAITGGETFQFETALPVDTFRYAINRTPHTPPLLIVSYNDAQGNHKFVADVEVAQIQEDLTRYYADMQRGLQLDVRQANPFQPGANRAWLTLHNPSERAISGGKVVVEVVTPEGGLVKEYVLPDQSFQPGPNVVTLDWNTADFTPAFNANTDYHLLVYAADRQGTIIEHTLRDLDTLAQDTLPTAHFPNTSWGFGVVTQGEVLQRTFPLANIGFADLSSRLLLSEGLSMVNTTSRRSLPGEITDFTLSLDTRALPTGPYTGTATLRTSDPANPLYTVQVTGEIVPITGDAYARKIEDRPLDVEVWVAGDHNQGDWIQFSDGLATDLHPVKIFSTESGDLVGLGKYGTPFGLDFIQMMSRG